jgi:hypothetical protein
MNGGIPAVAFTDDSPTARSFDYMLIDSHMLVVIVRAFPPLGRKSTFPSFGASIT